MARFKSNPIFCAILVVLAVAAAGQAWLYYTQTSKLGKTTREIAKKQQVLQAFSTQDPFPSKINLDAIEADLAQLAKTRADIRELLRANSDIALKISSATIPGTSTDAYFDIANFVESMRKATQQAGITGGETNRFGFNTYASTGPERDLIAPVFKQRQHIEYLVNALIKASPAEIISVQRERPLTPAQTKQLASALAAGQSAPALPVDPNNKDYFVIDSRTSARVPGFVSTSAYRLNFKGNTLVLRSLLNQLALFELPMVVRSVEVDPISKTGPSAPAPTPANTLASLFGIVPDQKTKEAEKPLVEKLDSRFTVTIEFVSLVDKNLTVANNP
ncbi:MAG: Amuc_1100 family pilus-like protein [Verrucomicrobia bacterium]|nr:Amuc_1100 family pilus-like protein [Verrucomicrobiota bacterium]